jgi:hypothetical protein
MADEHFGVAALLAGSGRMISMGVPEAMASAEVRPPGLPMSRLARRMMAMASLT